MQHLRIRHRWLVASAAVVALLVGLSLSTGAALGNSAHSSSNSGFGRQAVGQRPGGGGFGSFGGGGRGLGSNQAGALPAVAQLSVVASRLGITPPALQQERASGKTLTQIISEHGATVDQVVAALVAQSKSRLDDEVVAGRLTQQQETQALAQQQRQDRMAIENGSLGSNQPQFPGRHP